MRSGCLNLVVTIGVASIAAVLTVLGVVLLVSISVSSPGQPVDVERVVQVVAALVAGYSFFLVGRSVWRDIKEHRHPAVQAKPEDSGSTGHGEG